jgi:hypothetical protein
VTLHAGVKAMVRDACELLGAFDDPESEIRMKLSRKGDVALPVGRGIVAEATDQAHQQGSIFNGDHVATACERWRRTRDEDDRLSAKVLGSAEVGGAVSGVQPDRRLVGRREAVGSELSRRARGAPRGIDGQFRLEQSCVLAADPSNATIATDQFPNGRFTLP